MVEPEMAFFELEDNMRLAEAFLKRIFRDALAHCGPEMQFFRERIDPTAIETLESIVAADFVRLSYTDAIAILEKSGRQFEFPIAWGKDLQAEHERYLTEQEFRRPVIIHDYPREIKSFYMRVNEDGRTVRAMDVLAPKVGEIIGGSQAARSGSTCSKPAWRDGPRPGRLQLVSRPAPLRHGAALRVRPGAGAGAAIHQRHGQHPRRDPLPPHAG